MAGDTTGSMQWLSWEYCTHSLLIRAGGPWSAFGVTASEPAKAGRGTSHWQLQPSSSLMPESTLSLDLIKAIAGKKIFACTACMYIALADSAG